MTFFPRWVEAMTAEGSKKSSGRTRRGPYVPDIEFPEELSGLFHRYHDRVLADDSLSDLDVFLVSVYLIESKNKKTGVPYADCKRLFMGLGRKEVNYRVSIHNAKKRSLIEQADLLLYLNMSGLKHVRTLLGQIEKAPVHLIRSGQNFTAIKLLEEFLVQEIQSEDLLLCDPYVSSTTLFPFSVLKGKITNILILTTIVHDVDKFKEYKAKMEKETGITIEVKSNTKIHDRYLVSGARCWSFGASIKDLGNKDTTIREISEVASSVSDMFRERWKEASSLP